MAERGPLLRLCPDNKVSGEKVFGKGSRVTIALKLAASSLRQSDTYLSFGACVPNYWLRSRSRPWRQNWPG
jgi:hypothetical protein